MHRMARRSKLFGAGILAACLAATGVGIAAWSTSGSGTGSAKAATASPITLGDASASASADLYPGGSGALKLSVTNPNSFPIQITAVALTGGGTITSDKGAACNASHGVTLTTQSGLALTVAAGATSALSIAGAVSMSNTSDTSCQGALFSIPVTAASA